MKKASEPKPVKGDPGVMGLCSHCGYSIDIRNPSGECDHLKYPEYCETCRRTLEPVHEVPIEPEGMKPGQIPLTTSIESKMFADWIGANLRDIEHTQLLMAQPLTDDPNLLQPQMAEVEAWFERANALFADAKNFYYLAKREGLVARADGITDLDRESIQKGSVSNQRRVMDTLEGIVESIKTRLILGMSLRKAFAAETTKDRP